MNDPLTIVLAIFVGGVGIAFGGSITGGFKRYMDWRRARSLRRMFGELKHLVIDLKDFIEEHMSREEKDRVVTDARLTVIEHELAAVRESQTSQHTENSAALSKVHSRIDDLYQQRRSTDRQG